MATSNSDNVDGAEEEKTKSSTIFKATERTKDEPAIRGSLPHELWLTILESPCTFAPDMFSGVMLNLIKNPNVTSSHLFRADIFYDSNTEHASSGSLVKHLKQEYRPISYELPGFSLTRTIVRKLIPRNPQLDHPLVQTCHLFNDVDDGKVRNVVLYLPHVREPRDVPFYHPTVLRLAFEHIWQEADTIGSISISYSLFPDTTLTTKLERTALCLLQTVHKHGQGQLAGYKKRVHLDQIIPQNRYQDTYTRLKTKYGKEISEQWVEVTDPGKHVFEDLGIAAFLIELWRNMYQVPEGGQLSDNVENRNANGRDSRPAFPGFVDIGCGNGLLVYILLAEGYEGWGFDARERKTWRIFPDYVQRRLQRRLLISNVLPANCTPETQEMLHNGIFDPGTFIISNHGDELTAWTPLLAYLNKSAFIAIPCCSHDLSGARFRAPLSTKAIKQGAARLPQQLDSNDTKEKDFKRKPIDSQAAETGSLKRTEAQKKMPSAYSTLCSYVTSLAEEVGFEPETETLRIPSTRNQCIIGRRTRRDMILDDSGDTDMRRQKVIEMVERELGKSVEAVAADWVARAEKLAKKPGSGH